MTASCVQILAAAIGSLGFCLYAHVRAKHMIAASIGGALGWGVYLVLSQTELNLFMSTFAATAAVYIWCEIMARIMKAPVTLFLAPGIIPLLPGSNLYYTVLALLNQQHGEFQVQGQTTVIVTIGIASGVVLSSIVVTYVLFTVAQLRRRRS